MADKTYIVKITAQAEEQLQEVIKYITFELKTPKAALCLLNEIEHSISSLSQFPQRVTLIPAFASSEQQSVSIQHKC